jgi:hypothetical protein
MTYGIHGCGVYFAKPFAHTKRQGWVVQDGFTILFVAGTVRAQKRPDACTVANLVVWEGAIEMKCVDTGARNQ